MYLANLRYGQRGSARRHVWRKIIVVKYILKRVIHSLITLVIVISIVVLLLRQMPVEGYFNNYDKVSETQKYVKLQSLGLKDPAIVQIGKYLNQLLHGDLGTSNKYRENYPIAKIIARKAPVSIELGLLALALAILIGFPLGIAMARSTKGRWKFWDKFGTVLIVIVQAVPSAVYHILIQLYGSEWFGVSMLYDKRDWRTWILPVISLSLGSMVYYAMWLRRYMVDESNKDYIKLARVKGVSSKKINSVHIFRNAVVPLVQYLPESILFTLMGSLYVESLYSIPGMGGLLVQAIKIQDNTLVEALVVIYAALSVLGLLLGDLLMAFLDPRISLTRKEGSRSS